MNMRKLAANKRGNRANPWITALCVLGAAVMSAGLGGCNNKAKEQQELAMQEAAALREQNTQLSTALAQTQSQLAQCVDEKSKQPMTNDNGGGWDTSSSDRRSYTSEPEVTITVAGDVLFDSGSATLKKTAKTRLDEVVRTIRNDHGSSRVRVEGYTDSDPISKSKNRWSSNDQLSQARADAVKEYLQSKGVSRVTAVGMGSAKPKATKAASRRVEIVITG